MHHLSPLAYVWYYLWIAPHLLLLAIACLMWRRGWHGLYPWFFSYLLYEFGNFLITFILSQFTGIAAGSYRSLSAVLLLGSIGLRFGVVYEVFRSICDSYPVLLRTGRLLLGWVLVGLLFVSVLLAMQPAAGNADRLARMGIGLSRSMSLIQCGLLLFVLACCSYLKLSWNKFALGIAIGLGVFASVDLAFAAILSAIAPVSRSMRYVFDFVSMGTYHCCVLVWLGYLLAPERVVEEVSSLPANDLESWDRELERLLQR